MVVLSFSAPSSSTSSLMSFPPRGLASRGSSNRGKRKVCSEHGLRRLAGQRGGPSKVETLYITYLPTSNACLPPIHKTHPDTKLRAG